MKKKILAVLLVLCAVVLFALTASAATDTSVGYRVNVTLSADSYFCGTEGHTGEARAASRSSLMRIAQPNSRTTFPMSRFRLPATA